MGATQINDTGAGYQIGDSNDKVGFFGAAPVVQPAGTGFIDLPPWRWLNEGGGTTAALAIFSNGASAVPGFTNLSSEGLGVRWNNHTSHTPIITSFAKPTDLDDTAAAALHILAVRSATDAVDLTTFAVTAFENAVGAAAGADANFGGTSSAMANNTNIQELTLTLAASDLGTAQSQITLTLAPTSAVLATVDVTVLAVWIEYTNALGKLGLVANT
jgi:hypothetical protein